MSPEPKRTSTLKPLTQVLKSIYGTMWNGTKNFLTWALSKNCWLNSTGATFCSFTSEKSWTRSTQGAASGIPLLDLGISRSIIIRDPTTETEQYFQQALFILHGRGFFLGGVRNHISFWNILSIFILLVSGYLRSLVLIYFYPLQRFHRKYWPSVSSPHLLNKHIGLSYLDSHDTTISAMYLIQFFQKKSNWMQKYDYPMHRPEVLWKTSFLPYSFDYPEHFFTCPHISHEIPILCSLYTTIRTVKVLLMLEATA